MKRSKKAQLSFVNIFSWVILVILGAIFTPMIQGYVSETINNTPNISGITTLILQAIVPVFWLGIVITFFLYMTPIRPQQY